MSEEIKKADTEENIEKESENIEKTSVSRSGKNTKGLIFLVIFVVFVVGVLFLNKYGKLDGLLNGGVFSGSDVSSDVNPATVIATVNDVQITRGELDKKINSVKKALPPGASDPTEDAAFELQLLDDLIDLKLLVSEAEAKNYTASQDEVNAERATLVEQFGGEEELNKQLEKFGISQEELLENMRNELLIRQLLNDELSIDKIEITDDEIKEAYDGAIAGMEDAPPLEQVSDMLREQLKNQKSADIVSAYIAELRDKANIDIKL
jgi:hypothetical protein